MIQSRCIWIFFFFCNFRTTTNMNKAFCPHCGNNTLKKLAVTLGEDGSMQMHFSSNPKVLNPKGKRVSALFVSYPPLRC